MRRVIMGAQKGGVGSVLHDDEAPLIGRDQPPKELHMIWASTELSQVVDDLASRLDHMDFDLAPGELRFVRIRFAPHESGVMHRTPRTIDYITVLEGGVTVELGDGSSVELHAGDMGVQICGFHRWRNDGEEDCILSILALGIEADPGAPGREERA
jgi:quercetin dioxygenase-like cupin family protein